jgi:TetR/AcrR family transcriptional regulator, mexCD-oprJ operon repressor
MSETWVESVPKRADARRNIAAILDAATECLSRDPESSINDIARAAGVGRVTLYGHFDSRAALVGQVVSRAIAESEHTLGSVDVTGDPREALARLLDASCEVTQRFGSLVVAAEGTIPPDDLREAHAQPARRVRRLLRRGRAGGAFRRDMPVEWQVTLIQSIVHGASLAAHRGEITPAQAPRLVRDSVLGALEAR